MPLGGADHGVGGDVLGNQAPPLRVTHDALERGEHFARHRPAVRRQQIVAQLLYPRLSEPRQLRCIVDLPAQVNRVLTVLMDCGAFQSFDLGPRQPGIDRMPDRDRSRIRREGARG
jgi:hypothetical protein